ncbi:uncharacterized protein LOC135193955 [Vanessa tameamea]|uniref:Uncharacterized protein LOC135193955 n=1 Tax=Vanessa tameamea TaxID=334116 RepID=A0ABM4ATL7_VANTA
MSSCDGPSAISSEVGFDGAQVEGQRTKSDAEKLLSSMEALLSRVLASQQTPTANTTHSTQLLPFNPDDEESDVEAWCNITEAIVLKKNLNGIDLLMALTSALKGRAAACITKVNINEMTWTVVKQCLMAKFSKPKLPQDYFDDILRFQIAAKETVSESALRLWSLIERIPKCTMPEEVVTGFVISVLCKKDGLIRRELNAHNIMTRTQLFRVLGGVSLKRQSDGGGDTSEPEIKRFRSVERFSGRCSFCGIRGHRFADCRKRRDNFGSASQEVPSSSRTLKNTTSVSCYTCGKKGHVTTNCPDKKNGSKAAVMEVQHCEHRPSRGTLKTSSG